MTHEETSMEDEAPLIEDFRSPTAAKLMDVAFGLNGMARQLATQAEREELLERDRIRKREEYNRQQERLRQQRHRANRRILTQTQNITPAAHEGDVA